MNDLIAIAEQFVSRGKVIKVRELGEGNINQTFLVVIDRGENKHFVLQQINTQVFTQPELIMDNIQIFTNHVNHKLAGLSLGSNRCWQVPQVLLTSTAKHHYLDRNNRFWRAITFIENAQSYNTIQNLEHAQEIGYGLGIFHTLISDLDVTRLADTLPGFHIAPSYLKQYHQALAKTTKKKATEVNYCQQFIQERINFVAILEQAKAQGILKLSPIHGDPKVNNIMIDNQDKKAIAMVDLDTIKPGLIHYDIGDCLRSGCNTLGEETSNWEKVQFDLNLAQAILQGYLSIADNFITQQELEYIYEGIRLIAFELGLRFFTDYLNNDIYFKTNYAEHNLRRALVQFQLTKSIESQEKEIRNLIIKL
ncbi:Aminoglycoside phosphotransferase [Hyella patelloides LEGE 07179]|uniref:Aminoglycoside phosphotransferase n=1 Tax=Hyella patelloides LEGE 07179 TaxID=945734 RepID=A0A563W0H8_9CYAN|nr:aminoglycoside phosphotransferase family protein [Hyella patelloides]VEP17222.1 Aminoglycoside phosphotransferase [Hyella patelloides LEGE 07179]